jgi:hypothetical protein
MLRTIIAFVALISLAVGARAQEMHFWGQELSPIFEVLGQGNLSGLLEISGQYDPTGLPGIPQFQATARTGASPLQNVRQTVRNVPEMRVEQHTNGTFIIKQRGVPTDILDIQISHLAFEDLCDKIYSSNRALSVILRAPEVVAYANSHKIGLETSGGGIGTGGGVGSGCGQRPFGSPPHISGSIDHVTVLQALERVFQAFPGEVLVYWDFPERKNGLHNKSNGTRHLSSLFSSDCRLVTGQDSVSTITPVGLPDPFCLPSASFSALPSLFPTVLEAPAQRRVFFWFFSSRLLKNYSYSARQSC